MDNTEKVIKRLENYLSLIRFQYSTEEQLSRLNILDDYYKSLDLTPTDEKLGGTIEFAEQLSSKLILPLKVKGIFLTEGRPERKFYLAEELSKSVDNPVNHKFPLALDHRNKEVGSIIGSVNKIKYDDAIKGLRWWGNINDETVARNLLDGVIDSVSVTVFSVADYDEEHGLLGRNLVFQELSLVKNGAEKMNTIEVA